MPTAVRIAVVGAGSAQFSLGLVRDLCLTDALRGSTVVLMDVDPDRLETVATLARRYADEMGSDLRVEQTLDREAALAGADFVVNTALAGGHGREEAERTLLDRHGYHRGLHPAEGFFHQYDLMLAVARDVERLCPDAWLIQSSNPVSDGCTLMTRETGANVVGLCHGPFGGVRELARTLDLDPDHVTFEAPGVNHCLWMTQFRYRGQDAYPLLDRWIEEESEAFWRDREPRFAETQLSPAAIHLYRFYGLLPLGDASRAIWPEAWWYHLDAETKRRWWPPFGGFDSDEGWGRYLAGLERGLARIKEVAADPSARVTEAFPPTHSGEQIVPIVDAVANDRRSPLLVNVANRGTLKGLPDDVVVEVPAIVDRGGVRPAVVEPLPQRVMLGAIYPQWLAMERRLAGFLARDSRYLMQVLLAEGRTRSWEHAETTLDAVMRMPRNEAMARHFGVEPGDPA
ncbi:MAG: alpha-glucosidase/alpha-galactosidase [Chloroflexota bacterium]|nr:alpha-glucosidase/alpha-galactosidase [Chloroflexota bacterium]